MRPTHLWLGTQADNNADMSRKGRDRKRALRGEDSPTHKLTAEQVREIRRLDAEGILGPTAIARLFGVHPTNVHLIRRGKNWKHLSPR